jgi:ureidoacrylate peracid hydrolase
VNDSERELAMRGTVFVELPCFEINPKRTALLTIDMQYLDAHPDFGIGQRARESGHFALLEDYFSMTAAAVEQTARLQSAARTAGIELIHIRIRPHTEDARECPPVTRQRKVRFPRSSRESDFLEAIAPRPGEIALTKITSSAFLSTDLALILHNLGIDTVITCGVITNGCVESTVRDGRDLGFKMVVASDCCASWTRELHERSLRYLAVSFGNVRHSDELIAELALAPRLAEAVA